MARDWHAWYEQYDDRTSNLSRRLLVVRELLAAALDDASVRRSAAPRLVSMCAGDGRDTLPVLAQRHRDTSALLVELDERLSIAARARAGELGLDGVEVRTWDAGTTDA